MKPTDDLEVINSIYKPYKYTIKGNVKILNCNDKDIVLKRKCNILHNRFQYLDSRGFSNYVPLIDSSRSNYDIFPYIYENKIPYEQKGNDLARVVAIMHAKTCYNKDIDESVYDNIYTNITNNCDYLIDYYSRLYDDLFPLKYHKPHEIIFIDSYSKINNTISFCKSEIEKWYTLVSEKRNQRVTLIHNNLKLDHFLKGSDDYLISFDNSRFDTPVIDLVKLYKEEYDKLDFSELLNNYLYHFSYNEDELKLFFVLITIPDEICFKEDNYKNVELITNLINYINKTESLVWPYYSNNKEIE